MLLVTALVTTAFIKPRAPQPVSEHELRSALEKSIPLMQRSAYMFAGRSAFHCAGCHHHCLTALLEEKALEKGLPLIDSLRQISTATIAITMSIGANPNRPDDMAPTRFGIPYGLVSLAAEKYPADEYTDMAVDFILNSQLPNGSWQADHFRIPAETGEMHLAALSIRSVQRYASPSKKDKADSCIAKARRWLENTKTSELEQEKTFQLLGLKWAGASPGVIKQLGKELIALQQADGGWSQLPTMTSDAYATGETLYTLKESGALSTDDPAYQRGMRYLLAGQQSEGGWIVVTRAVPVQPFFNAGFPPHDENQFISAAATNWASLALAEALPDK